MKMKILISFMVLALIGLLVGGNTIAYFTDTVKEELVKFAAGTVEINFDDGVSINTENPFVDSRTITWSIKNTGTNDVFLRVKVITNTDEVKFKVKDDNWVKGEDDYYYYSKAVALGDAINFSLEVNFDIWDPTTALMDLEVEAIQASNNVRKSHWNWPES